ncbi:hypothetical protein ABFX02_14G232900 [Erythranthe guttata]
MDEIEIPQYFVCPISLQIMKDPVTTATGITYDRDTIQQWISSSSSSAVVYCPVTKQPLTPGSELTPNHMLRRLIQAWCVANANNGVDRIPTPKSPLHRASVIKLLRDVNRNVLTSLKKLDELAGESVKNRECMAEAGVAKAMILYILRCFRSRDDYNNININYESVEEAFRILQLTWRNNDENKNLVEDNLDFVGSVLWVLRSADVVNSAKTHALMVLKNVMEIASSNLVANLELDFFQEIVKFLRRNCLQVDVIKAALHVLIHTCTSGRNRTRIVEAGGVFAAVEVEIGGGGTAEEKRISELVFCLLAELCSCADGRQEFLRHAGGVAVATKRLLRVSAEVDDRAMYVFESIARFSATREVVAEMLRVGAVSKMCMVLQADCAVYLKKKARQILRLHSNAWTNSPCIQVYLLTMNPR